MHEVVASVIVHSTIMAFHENPLMQTIVAYTLDQELLDDNVNISRLSSMGVLAMDLSRSVINQFGVLVMDLGRGLRSYFEMLCANLYVDFVLNCNW